MNTFLVLINRDIQFLYFFLPESAYTERYMGLPLPTENFRGYQKSSLLEQSKWINGKDFFLAHGMADRNVHFQNSMILAKTLVSHNVPFEQHVSWFFPSFDCELYRSLKNNYLVFIHDLSISILFMDFFFPILEWKFLSNLYIFLFVCVLFFCWFVLFVFCSVLLLNGFCSFLIWFLFISVIVFLPIFFSMFLHFPDVPWKLNCFFVFLFLK